MGVSTMKAWKWILILLIVAAVGAMMGAWLANTFFGAF